MAGLDDDKLSLLSKWAGGLRNDDRPEVAAAGRAIEMLIDEVERLNVLIWFGPLNAVPTTPEPEPRVADIAHETGDDLASPLQARLRQRIGAALQRGASADR